MRLRSMPVSIRRMARNAAHKAIEVLLAQRNPALTNFLAPYDIAGSLCRYRRQRPRI